MKSIILSLLLLMSVTKPFPTIILINGSPYFVMLDEEFYISEIFQAVPDYFESDLTHEQIVSSLISSSIFQKQITNYPEIQFVSEDIKLLEDVEFIQVCP